LALLATWRLILNRKERKEAAKSAEKNGGTCAMYERYAVGWFTLALINAGLAQGKDKSGLLWFLISLLLGPVATFLLVALVKKRHPEHPHEG
jgi:hypothetical protein